MTENEEYLSDIEHFVEGLESHAGSIEASLVEMKRKLDEILQVLQRIDRKTR